MSRDERENHLLEQDVIWKIQTETYQREIERYGENTIENSETLFWHDSELILKYLDLKDNKVKTGTEDLKNLNFGFQINL